MEEVIGELIPRVRAIWSELEEALGGFHFVSSPGGCRVFRAEVGGKAGQIPRRKPVAVAPSSLHGRRLVSEPPFAGAGRTHAGEREGGVDLKSLEESLGRFTEVASSQQCLSVQVGS